MQKEETIWTEIPSRSCGKTGVRLGCWATNMQVEMSEEEDDGDDQCYVFWVLLRTLNGVRFEFRVKQVRKIIPKIYGMNP